MGNSPSKTNKRRSSISSRELEKFTKPTGLYPTCPWEVKAARRLIVDRKIAPRFPGKDGKESCYTQECPICFMFYPGNLNFSLCCKKPICSECFLQMKPPQRAVCCPFCNRDTFNVNYTAPASTEMHSIFSEKSLSPLQANNGSKTPPSRSVESKPAPPHQSADPPITQQYASVEERQRIQDDLRTQLNISNQPIRGTPHPNSHVLQNPRFLAAAAAEAARLEELMMMEAIRRSMLDLRNAKPDNSQNEEDNESIDDDDGDVHAVAVDLTQIRLSAASSAHTSPRRQAHRPPNWNLFDE